MREEIVDVIKGSDGRESAIVTRNGYGALVLNAARVMFIDIDFDMKVKSGGLSGLFRQLGGKGAAPSPVDEHLARIEEWARRNPQWSMRVYRTFGGLARPDHERTV